MDIEQKSVARICRRIQLRHGIMQPAGVKHDGQGAIDSADHLGQAAGVRIAEGMSTKSAAGKGLVGQSSLNPQMLTRRADPMEPDDFMKIFS